MEFGNTIDRLIGVFRPSAELKRARQRYASRLIRNQYDGAISRRTNDGWITASTSANSEIKPSLVRLRDRARELVRNNAYAARVVDVWVAHLVGDGITVQANSGDEAVDELLQPAWDAWALTEDCDADGQSDFNGLQALCTRSMVESGESLLRLRTRRIEDGLPVPMQLQAIEADFLDHTKNEQLPNGGMILMGVQFGPLGDREGYWLYRNHPGDNFFAFQRSSTFVPADQVIHLYWKKRPGQVRAVTWLAAAINKIRDMDDLDEARVVKAKIEACLTVVVKSTDPDSEVGARETSEEDTERDLDTVEPGVFKYLRPDESIEVVNPSTGGGFDSEGRRMLQAIAVATGVTYDQLTGDLSNANYSSLRAGKIEFRRSLSQVQWQVLIPMLVERTWNRFVVMGGAAGLWRSGINYKASYMPPRNEPIDPKKDTDAEAADLAAGLASWSDTVRARGKDPRQHAQELADDEKMLRDLGLERLIEKPSPAVAAAQTTMGDVSNEA